MVPMPCTCGDLSWRVVLIVDGEVVDEQTFDAGAVDVDDEGQVEAMMHRADTVSQQHLSRAEAASEAGLSWSASMLCPSCGAGVVIGPEGLVSTTPDA